VTIAFWKDTITMADQFLMPGWYLQPTTWPYSIPNGPAALWPRNEPLIQNSPWSASNGGILGLLAQGSAGLDRPPASGGILGTLTASPADIARGPNVEHPALAADGHALRTRTWSASSAGRSADATDVAAAGFIGAIESVRAPIRPFRFEQPVLATNVSAVRRNQRHLWRASVARRATTEPGSAIVAPDGSGFLDTANAICAAADVFRGAAERRQSVFMANPRRLKCRSSRVARA
jgi:hypothetical protein